MFPPCFKLTIPYSVPGVGLTPTETPSKDYLGKALAVAKKSTASIGKFTENLPKEKPSKSGGKKRKVCLIIWVSVIHCPRVVHIYKNKKIMECILHFNFCHIKTSSLFMSKLWTVYNYLFLKGCTVDLNEVFWCLWSVECNRILSFNKTLAVCSISQPRLYVHCN